MNNIMISAGVISLAIITICLVRFRVHSSPFIAEKVTYDQLPEKLIRLKTTTNPADFVGYCSRDADALYFVFEQGIYHLDYELYSPAKLAHESDFSTFAKQNDLKMIETKYIAGGPKVLRIPLNADETHSVEIAYKLGSAIWGHTREMKFDLLP